MFQRIKNLLFCESMQVHYSNFRPLKQLIMRYGMLPLIVFAGVCLINDLIPFIYDLFDGDDYYYESILEALGGGTRHWSITVITYFLSFVITYVLGNGTLNAYQAIIREERKITINEYIGFSIQNLWTFIIQYLLRVELPLFLLSLAGTLLNFIPLVSGVRLATFIARFISYALIFKFIARMTGQDREGLEIDYIYYWGIYAVASYVISMAFSFTALISVVQMLFIPYTLLVLAYSKRY